MNATIIEQNEHVNRNESPYVVPPFDPGTQKPEVMFYWWSWHPLYPRWSKSCWGGKTVDDAWRAYAEPCACGLRNYHNKLIREGDGQLTEVVDHPCQNIDVWWTIFDKGMKP